MSYNISQGSVLKQRQVTYNELELQFKSITLKFLGWIFLQADLDLASLCLIMNLEEV